MLHVLAHIDVARPCNSGGFRIGAGSKGQISAEFCCRMPEVRFSTSEKLIGYQYDSTVGQHPSIWYASSDPWF
jgi:hypothetical protein